METISNNYFQSYEDREGQRRILISAWKFLTDGSEKHIEALRSFIRIATAVSSMKVIIDLSTPPEACIMQVPTAWLAYAIRANEHSRLFSRIEFKMCPRKIADVPIVPSRTDLQNLRCCDEFYMGVLIDCASRLPEHFSVQSTRTESSAPPSVIITLLRPYELTIARRRLLDWERYFKPRLTIRTSADANDNAKKIVPVANEKLHKRK
jgi:hypothetical protein